MKRVVVTGLGMVTPLACGVEPTWRGCWPANRRRRGSRTSTSPTSPARSPRRCRAAPRPTPSIPTSGWSPRSSAGSTISSSTRWPPPTQALRDADWAPKTYEDEIETGVLIGSGIGGLGGIAETVDRAAREGPAPRLAVLHSRPPDQSGLRPGLDRPRLKGPNHAVVTACSTGAHAIGDAARLIALGDADVMVAGGAESAVNRSGARRLHRLPRAVDRLQRSAQAGLAPL